MDLNGDGILDIISGRYSPPLVTWFEGTKSGYKKGVMIEEVGIDRSGRGSGEMYQATASFVDWDGDGDLDLIVGNNSGQVFLNINEGTAKRFKFGKRVALTVGGAVMKVPNRSDPLAVDWDGDGELDLLVSDESCGVTFFKGATAAGEKGRTFAPGVSIVPGRSRNLVPGYRAKIAVADWNNDGKLDLLVGNCEHVTVDGRNTLTGHVYLFLRK